MQQYPDEKYCIMFLYMDDQQKLDKRHLLGKRERQHLVLYHGIAVLVQAKTF